MPAKRKRTPNPPRPEAGRGRPGRDADRSSRERALDEVIEESFPASDPPSYTGTHAGKPRPDKEEKPKIRRRGTR